MDLLTLLMGLIALTVVVDHLLKTASSSQRTGIFRCRRCKQWMDEVPNSWYYQLPFEVWACVSKYNLKPQSVRRFRCPDNHTIAWYLPIFGDRDCDVLVTKTYQK